MNPCACRDCMDLATVPGSLCWECEQADCIPLFECCRIDPTGAGDRIQPHPRVWPNYIDNPE